MKKRILAGITAVFIFTMFFSACSGKNNEDIIEEKDKEISSLRNQIHQLNAEISGLQEQLDSIEILSSTLLTEALAVVQLIALQDMEGFSGYVHPIKGVRFSPYGYIDVENHQLFTATETMGLTTSSQIYTWGAYDGIGDPIELVFSDYYDRFIYDEDYANPQLIGNNVIIGKGNSLINIDDVYPDGEFIEFHFTGFDPEFIGFDWRSLRIIFELYNGDWYVVAVVHDEWTI